MIVRAMPNGQILCIPQATHALMAGEFCRYWGNQDFAVPYPLAPTLMAVTQHDCGWTEWDEKPKLRADGYPTDFMNDENTIGKVELWRRGVNRVFSQHPYAALLVGRHAYWLYESMLQQAIISEEERMIIADFMADQQMLIEYVRYIFVDDAAYTQALSDEVIEQNARLVQFGDAASLVVSVPWGTDHTFTYTPPDKEREPITLHMHVADQSITFDPWPYHIDEFEVTMSGWLLPQNRFADEVEYHRVLGEANYYRRTWWVYPAQ